MSNDTRDGPSAGSSPGGAQVDTNRGVILTNAETGRFGVYEYDFGTDTRGATLFEHPEVDVDTVIESEGGVVAQREV